MTNLLSQVTPLTKGLLWFTSGELSPEKSFYKDVDYLLNGLLTATLKSSSAEGSHVLISENFGQSFFVIVGNKVSEKEFNSYFNLINPQLTGEGNILLIDETGEFEKMSRPSVAQIQSRIQRVQ